MSPLSLSEFGDRVIQIMPLILRQLINKQQDELLKGRITPTQFLILDFLNRKGQSKMTDLARFMEVTTAAMTGIVDKLVRDGYAVRVYDPEDRRIIKIRLTEKGNEFTRRIRQQRRQMIIKVFSKISEADRNDYLRVLTHLEQILIEEEASRHA